MGTGPVDRHTLNSEYVMYLCHTHNRFINVVFNLKKTKLFLYAHENRHSSYLDFDLDRERDLDLEWW